MPTVPNSSFSPVDMISHFSEVETAQVFPPLLLVVFLAKPRCAGCTGGSIPFSRVSLRVLKMPSS